MFDRVVVLCSRGLLYYKTLLFRLLFSVIILYRFFFVQLEKYYLHI
jgi:hypothetical protein